MGLIQKIIRGGSFPSMIAMGLRFGGTIFTLPLALRVIPTNEYGLYTLFVSIASLATLLDLGLASSISRNATFAFGGAKHIQAEGLPSLDESGRPNWVLFAQIFHAAKQLFIRIGLLAWFLLVIIGSWYLWGVIEKDHLPFELLICWIFYASSVVLQFTTSYWNDLLAGIGEVRACAWIQIAAQGISLLLLAALLLMGFKLWAYAWSSLISVVIGRFLTARNLKQKAAPAFRSDSRGLEEEQWLAFLKDMWPMAWRQGVVGLGAYAILNANTFLCARYFGLSVTASYGTSFRILSLIIQVCWVPLNVILPTVIRLRVQRNLGEVRRIYVPRLYLCVGAAFVGMLMFSFFADDILLMAGSKTKLLPLVPLLSLSVVMLLEMHHSVYAVLVTTENRNPFVYPALLSGIAVILLSVGFHSIWGFISGISLFSNWHFTAPILALILGQGVAQLAWNNWWTVWQGWRGLKNQEIQR